MKIKAGEVWRITHSRKGSYEVEIIRDLDAEKDEWFDGTITSGRAKFASVENRVLDAGATGNTLTMRTAFVTFNYRVDQPAKAAS